MRASELARIRGLRRAPNLGGKPNKLPSSAGDEAAGKAPHFGVMASGERAVGAPQRLVPLGVADAQGVRRVGPKSAYGDGDPRAALAGRLDSVAGIVICSAAAELRGQASDV